MITSVTMPTIKKSQNSDLYELNYITVHNGYIVNATDEILIKATLNSSRQCIMLFISDEKRKKQIFLTFLRNHIQYAGVDLEKVGADDFFEKAIIKLFNAFLCCFIKELKEGGIIK